MLLGLPGGQNRGTGEYYVKRVFQNNIPVADLQSFQTFGGKSADCFF